MLSLLVSTTLALWAAEVPVAPIDSAPSPASAMVTANSKPERSSFDRVGRWQVGFSGGVSSGGGLAVRYWWDAKNGIELHGFASGAKSTTPNSDEASGNYGSTSYYYSGNSDTTSTASGEISLGVQYLREFFAANLFDGEGPFVSSCRLRGLAFVGIGGYEYYYDHSGKSTTSQIEEHQEERQILGGAGGGLELEFSRLSVHLLVGYGGNYEFGSSSYGVGPTIDGGIFFRF